MNRLVIIGNGFDLAHGLPTGYCDFIDWYWKEVISNLAIVKNNKYGVDSYTDVLVTVEFHFFMRDHPDDYDPIIEDFKCVDSYQKLAKFIGDFGYMRENVWVGPGYRSIADNCSINIKNNFFRIINDKKEIQNWVDIENEYYEILKDCLHNEKDRKYKTDVIKLNKEFEEVKQLLHKYLYEEVSAKYNFENSIENDHIVNIFDLKERLSKKKLFLSEFADSDQKSLENWIADYRLSINNMNNEFKSKNLFLNFNYTPTVDHYSLVMNGDDKLYYGESEEIQIHGKLNNKLYPINFGFGDEMDDDYKIIEKKDDNEYLMNIKSFQYLQNSNYKKMLSFIESDKFQVYVMGHSCGLSDRILLNKIFEHNNCRSIKVFYYKNGDKDNYTDIVQNISRHFNKKEMMREKIVNKTLCQPLPQIQLPLKQ